MPAPCRAGVPDTAREALALLFLSQEPLLPYLYPLHIAWHQCPQREAGSREQPNADHLSEEIIWMKMTRAGENLQKEHLNEGSIWRKIIHAQEYLEEEHLNQRSVWGEQHLTLESC